MLLPKKKRAIDYFCFLNLSFVWPIAWHGPSSLGHANMLLLVDSLGRKTRETEIIIIYINGPEENSHPFMSSSNHKLHQKLRNIGGDSLTGERARDRASQTHVSFRFYFYLFTN
jgi:hypothetical protein